VPTLSGLIAALLAALASPVTATHHSTFLARATATAPRVQVLRAARPDERTRTCSARGQNTKAGRVERRLDPVACEQPPRSKVILTPLGGFDRLFRP
jgi:hypothetical protein